jgi:peptidyl-prolyl cis-trans isomerase B (cyclophilin B)
MGMSSSNMKSRTAIAVLASSLIVLPLSVPSQATAAAKIVCKTTTAKARTPMKTNPPQTVAKKLPKQLILRTNCGTIEIALDPKAPFTVTQIAALARAGYYNKTLCHREAVSGFYMLQCGDPTAQGSGDPGFSYPDENLPIGKALTYPAGTVAMANSGANTNGSQFFLVFGDSPTLGPSYTIWGKITKGLDVLKFIASKGVTSGPRDPVGIGKPNINVAIESAIVKG